MGEAVRDQIADIRMKLDEAVKHQKRLEEEKAQMAREIKMTTEEYEKIVADLREQVIGLKGQIKAYEKVLEIRG